MIQKHWNSLIRSCVNSLIKLICSCVNSLVKGLHISNFEIRNSDFEEKVIRVRQPIFNFQLSIFNFYLPFSSREVTLTLCPWEKSGSSARRNGQVQPPLADVHANSAIGGGLGGFNPCDAVAWLRVDKEVFVSRTIGVWTDACQRLVEQYANTIVAVVHATAVTVPRLPSSGGPLLNHVQITGVVGPVAPLFII